MEVMKFTEAEWLEIRSMAKRRYHREVERRRMIWQKVNGVLMILMALATWKIWNSAGHILVCIPFMSVGVHVLTTKEHIN